MVRKRAVHFVQLDGASRRRRPAPVLTYPPTHKLTTPTAVAFTGGACDGTVPFAGVLTIAAEFEDAGHESWLVDDAERAMMQDLLPTRTEPPQLSHVTFRDFCLYAEEGEEYLDINHDERVRRMQPTTAASSSHVGGANQNSCTGASSSSSRGRSAAATSVKVYQALAHLAVDVLSSYAWSLQGTDLPKWSVSWYREVLCYVRAVLCVAPCNVQDYSHTNNLQNATRASAQMHQTMFVAAAEGGEKDGNAREDSMTVELSNSVARARWYLDTWACRASPGANAGAGTGAGAGAGAASLVVDGSSACHSAVLPGLPWSTVRLILKEAVTLHGYTRFARRSKKRERERWWGGGKSRGTATAVQTAAQPCRCWEHWDELEAATLLSVTRADAYVSFRQFCVVAEAPEPFTNLTTAATAAAGAGVVPWCIPLHRVHSTATQRAVFTIIACVRRLHGLAAALADVAGEAVDEAHIRAGEGGGGSHGDATDLDRSTSCSDRVKGASFFVCVPPLEVWLYGILPHVAVLPRTFCSLRPNG